MIKLAAWTGKEFRGTIRASGAWSAGEDVLKLGIKR